MRRPSPYQDGTTEKSIELLRQRFYGGNAIQPWPFARRGAGGLRALSNLETSRESRFHGPWRVRRRRLAQPMVRHLRQRRALRAVGAGLSPLGHSRRRPRTLGRGRLSRRARTLSPLCLAGLPLRPSHHHLPQAEAARGCDLGVAGRAGDGRAGLGVRRGRDRRPREREAPPRRDSISSPIRVTPVASRCPSFGTRSGGPSSTTNCRKSSAC